MKQKKRLIISILSVVLGLVICVGTTLAYQAAKLKEVVNTFSSEKNIRAILTEPNWDADQAMQFLPGMNIPKDPMITNICDVEEYAAIRITFQRSDKSTILSEEILNTLLPLLEIDWNVGTGAEQWTRIDDSTNPAQPIYIYNSSVKQGNITKPLFHSVSVITYENGLTESDLLWLQGQKLHTNGTIIPDPAALGGFNIKVEGAVVQSLGFNQMTDAYTPLIGLFP